MKRILGVHYCLIATVIVVVLPMAAQAAEAVVVARNPNGNRVTLKSSVWEQKNPDELSALLVLANDSKLAALNSRVLDNAQFNGAAAQSKITLNLVKNLPAGPAPTVTLKRDVIDHYEAVPASSVPVYKVIEVDAGSALGD